MPKFKVGDTITCTKNIEGTVDITPGEKYIVLQLNGNYIVITDDSGDVSNFWAGRFVLWYSLSKKCKKCLQLS